MPIRSMPQWRVVVAPVALGFAAALYDGAELVESAAPTQDYTGAERIAAAWAASLGVRVAA